MKYIILIFLLLISCKKKIEVNELIYIEDLSIIKDYISYPIEKKSDSISWDYFNKVNLEQAKVISINPKLNELEFIYLRKDRNLIIYYQHKKFKIFCFNKSVDFEDVDILID